MEKQSHKPETGTGISKLPEEFGTKRDVARMVGMSVRSISNFMALGLPHVKLSKRRVRFDLPDCRQWFKDKFGQQRVGKLGDK